MTTIEQTYHLHDYPLIYTLCFLYRDDEILMLLRNKAPNAGLWNGVGGHIENGESPHAGCLREVQEETGYCLDKAKFCGVLTWHGYEVPAGGLYIFTAHAPQFEPIQTDEGKLAWKSRDFLFNSPEVVNNIHHFGPYIFDDHFPCIHHFNYHAGIIQSYHRYQLPKDVQKNKPTNRTF